MMPEARTPDRQALTKPAGGRPPIPASDTEWQSVLAARGGDHEAVAPLVQRAIRDMTKLIRRAVTFGQAVDDLTQAAALGVLEALRHYDPKHGVSVRSFAAVWARRAVLAVALGGAGAVSASRTQVRLAKLYRIACLACRRSEDGQVDLEQVAIMLGKGPRRLSELARLDRLRSARLGQGGAAGGPERAVVADPEAPVILADELAFLFRQLAEALDGHDDPRLAVVLRARFGLPPYLTPQTYRSVGQLIGVSHTTVAVLERRALAILRRGFGGIFFF